MSRLHLFREKEQHLAHRGKRHRGLRHVGYHRPLFEWLEARWVLSAPSVTALNPPANSHIASLETELSLTYDQVIDSATVSPQSFVVHGMQTGQLLDAPISSGDTVSLTPTQPFHAGELVQVTATSGIDNLDEQGPVSPVVWQFRTRTAGGTGFFSDDGPVSLKDSSSLAVAIGDLDGDGDLDVFKGNKHGNSVRMNGGNGQFRDTGQVLGGFESYSVALGDLDGDGDLDVFVANGEVEDRDEEPNTVWINDGNGSFSDTGQRLGDSVSSAVALGDLDGDGDLDAFLGNSYANRVWLNAGHGSFVDSGQRLGIGFSEAVALGDLDGDGDLDALVANRKRGPSRVWINDGQGNFTGSGSPGYSNDVALGDLDGDGDLDAFFGNFADNHVWLNDGHAIFHDSQQRLGSSYTSSVALGDLDGDGDLDAYVGNRRDQPNTVWLNDGTGRFHETQQRLGNTTALSVALGDLDGDGDLDAMTASDEVWLNVEVPADLSVAVNNDQFVATPRESVTYTITVTNHGPHDVSGATITDAFPRQITSVSWTCAATEGSHCTERGDGNVHDTVSLLAGGTATYTATGTVDPVVTGTITNVATVSGPMGLQDIGPVNNTASDTDVVPPVVVTPQLNSHAQPTVAGVSATFQNDLNLATVSATTFAVHGMRTGQLLEPTSEFTAEGNTISVIPAQPFHAGELVQVTATTRIENLVGGAPTKPFVWQFRAGARGGTGVFIDSGQSLGLPATRVALGDLDSDGDLDALDTTIKLWLNDGQGNFSDNGQRLGGSSTRAVALGDLDGDGDLDAFAGVGFPVRLNKVWLNDGQGNFRDSGQNLGDSRTSAVALGDLDGDGDLDAFVANTHVSGDVPNKVWLNDGQGNFRDSGQSLGKSRSGAVALSDLDGDGDLDAFVGFFSPFPRNEIWLNDGQGNFSDSGQSLGDSGIFAVALGDLDADGDVDAFVGDKPNRVWLNDGQGIFTDSGQNVGDFRSNSVALGDLDGDGDLDVFVGNWLQPNRVWLNDGHGIFADSGQSFDDLRTHSVALGDLDGDGDLDAFVGNVPGSVPNSGSDKVWLNQDASRQAAPGDANRDWQFDQSDIAQVLQAGKYLTGEPADWTEGEWNGDGVFDQLDLVAALQSGNYLQGPYLAKGAEDLQHTDTDVEQYADLDAVDHIFRLV